MKISFLSGVVESLTKRFFFLLPRVAPHRSDVLIAELLQAIDEGERVTNWASEHYFGRGQLAVRIRRVAELHHCSEESIRVKGSRWTSVGAEKPLG